jgi:hypothetical protein
MGSLGVDINISSSAEVSGIREGLEGGGSGGAGDSPCIHLAEDHSSRFYETEGCVDGKEFANEMGRVRDRKHCTC